MQNDAAIFEVRGDKVAGFTGYKRTIKLDFDYQEVKKGIPQVNQQMALLNAEFNKASAAADKNGSSMDKLKLNYDKLTNQVKLQSDKVDILRADLEKLTSSEVKNDKAITNKQIALRNAEAQLTRLQTAQEKANTAIKDSNTSLGKFKGALEDTKKAIEDNGGDIDKLKDTFTVMATAAAGIGVKGAQEFVSFDEVMIKSRTIMDENAVSYEKMTKNVLTMAEEYGISAQDVAEANYQILSSGVQTADANKMLEESLRLAKTGFTDSTVSADVLTSIMNAYSMKISDVKGVTDSLIASQKVGKFTIGELGDSLGNVISIAAQTGVSVDEVNAAIATMTLSGMKADTAITNTKAILTALISPTAEAAEEAKRLGIQFNVGALEAKGFDGFLEDVNRKTRGNSESLGLMFGNVRSLNGMMSLGTEGGQKYQEVLGQISNSAGRANEALKVVQGSTSDQFKTAINSVQIALIRVGEALSPLIDLVADVMEWIGGLNPVVLGLASGFGMLVIGIKAALWVGGAMKSLFLGIQFVMGLFTTSSAVAGGAAATAGAAAGAGGGGFMMLGQGVSMSLGPLLLIIAAIAAVALVIGLCIGNMKGFQNGLKQATEDAGDAALETANQAERAQQSVQNAQNASINASKKMYSTGSFATGTNFVPQDGYYRVNEYGQQETFLRRGDKVLNGAQTRQLNNNTDMEETNSLLRILCTEFKQMKQAYENQPRQIQRLAREGV